MISKGKKTKFSIQHGMKMQPVTIHAPDFVFKNDWEMPPGIVREGEITFQGTFQGQSPMAFFVRQFNDHIGNENAFDTYSRFFHEIRAAWSGACGEMVTTADISRAALRKTRQHFQREVPHV